MKKHAASHMYTVCIQCARYTSAAVLAAGRSGGRNVYSQSTAQHVEVIVLLVTLGQC